MAVDASTSVAACRSRFPIFERLVYVNSCSQGALSDAVRGAYGVQLIDQRDGRQLLAVHRYRVALLEANLHVRRRIRRLFRRKHPLPHRLFRSVGRIFQHAAFMAQVPYVAVAAVKIGLGLLDRYLVRCGVRQRVLAR